jgi:hypothetical protein
MKSFRQILAENSTLTPKQIKGSQTSIEGKTHERGVSNELSGNLPNIQSASAAAKALKAEHRRMHQREISSATPETSSNASHDINVDLDNGDRVEVDTKLSKKPGKPGSSHGEQRTSSRTVESVMKHLDEHHGDNISTSWFKKHGHKLISNNPDVAMAARREALHHIYDRFSKLRAHPDPKVRRKAREFLVTSSGKGKKSLIASTKKIKDDGHETVIFDKNDIINDDETERPESVSKKPYLSGNVPKTKSDNKTPKASMTDGHFRFSISGDQLITQIRPSAYRRFERRYDQHGNTIKESFFHMLKILRDNV